MIRYFKHISYFFILLGFTFLLFLLNHRWGSTYVGIDNISPFWGFDKILSQIDHSGNFLTFGPILYSWWFGLLSLLRVPATFQSTFYVWGYFFLSLLGYYYLASHLLKKKKSTIFAISYCIAFISSLVPLWIFSTHEMMFMSIFVAFPYMFIFMVKWELLKFWHRLLFTLFCVPLFYSSSINIVVFLVGFIALFIFVMAFSKVPIKIILLRFSFLAFVFLLLTQLLIILIRGPILLTTELSNHLSALSQSTDMRKITADLQNAERNASAFTNAARFATGWLDLYDEHKEHVFAWAKEFKKNTYIVVIQLFGIGLSLWFSTKAQKEHTKKLLVIFAIGILLLSPIGLIFINYVPAVNIALRSASTKLWMLIFIPLLLLETSAVSSLHEKKNWGMFLLASILLLISSYPWLIRQVYNSNNAPIIPREYETFYNNLSQSNTVLILPPPQVIYFRKYQWGYYGSDLLSYMTNAKIIDGSSFGQVRIEYEDTLKLFDNCTSVKHLISYSYITIEKGQSSGDYCHSSFSSIPQYTYTESYFTVYSGK